MRTIAHMITGLEIGGAEKMLLTILPNINDPSLFRHTVYCLKGRGAIGPLIASKGIPVVYCNYQNIFHLLGFILRLTKILRQNKPDIIVTHLIHADLIGRCIALFIGRPKVISFKHGALLQWEFLMFFDRLTSFLVTRYIAVSDSLKEKLKTQWHIPANKIHVIYNGIDLRTYYPQEPDKTLRKNLGIREKDMIFGIIGNLRYGKGHQELLHAAYMIKASTQPSLSFKILIIGDGVERERIEKTIQQLQLQDTVTMTGHRTDIPALLSVIDIFILPTYFEGMSVAILEAMATKKAIITTAIKENQEILQHNYSALLVPPKNYQTLAKAMKKILLDPSLRNRLTENAYHDCIQRYDLRQTIRLFQETLLTI